MLSIACSVNDPVLSCDLLLVTALVLGDGARAVDNESSDATIFSIVVAPCPCSCFGAERSNAGLP